MQRTAWWCSNWCSTSPNQDPHISNSVFPLKSYLWTWVLLALVLTLGFQVWEFGPWLWQFSISGFFLQILCFPGKLRCWWAPGTHFLCSKWLQDRLTWHNICFILYNIFFDFIFQFLMLCVHPYRAINLTEWYLLWDFNLFLKPSRLFCPPGRYLLYFRFVYELLKFYSCSKTAFF